MSNDPTTALAITAHANKGAYALLLGSGVSNAARVPTGWAIVLDLIRRIARLEESNCEPDPAQWYREIHQAEPDYSVLLGQLARTQPERSQLVRAYIEPTEEERALGLKQPTDAHRAIAELVAGGYVRVIVTTNFDHLIETALRDAGIEPTVIDSVDALRGSLPLVHIRCAVVKVHGDYVDARIRNTARELERYPGAINALLDRIFDEYGLIVCGWSADWDPALRAAVMRRRSRWFSTYWALRGEPNGAARKLIAGREAEVVQIADADAFFRKLADDVAALEDLALPESLSARMAQAAVERYIDDSTRRTRLRALVMAEANRVYRLLQDEGVGSALTHEEVMSRLSRYEEASEVLRAVLAAGCYWGDEADESHWVACLERLANLPRATGYSAWVQLRWYPALLSVYAGGIAAVANHQYGTLAAILTRPQVKVEGQRDNLPLVLLAIGSRVMEEVVANQLFPEQRYYLPINFYLFWKTDLWAPIRQYVPDDGRFQDCFDRFEYLLGLVHLDQRTKLGWTHYAPPGFFAARDRGFDAPRVATVVAREVEDAGEGWEPLRAGLFDGSLKRFLEVKAAYDDRIQRLGLT